MKLIYWNTNNTDIKSAIYEILSEYTPDILFISEVVTQLLIDFDSNIDDYEIYSNPGCDRITIIKRKILNLSLSLQNKYFTTVKNESNQYIIAVHFPSQMYQSHDALKNFFRNFRASIENEIGNSLDTEILVIGDFNISPFDKPMIDFDGFSATNSRNSRRSITNLQQTKSIYYNPTWKLFEGNHYPGTFHFPRPSATSFDILEHHILDQVLISPKLTDTLETEIIKVIEETTTHIFLNKTSLKLEISDHLPLYYEFKTN